MIVVHKGIRIELIEKDRPKNLINGLYYTYKDEFVKFIFTELIEQCVVVVMGVNFNYFRTVKIQEQQIEIDPYEMDFGEYLIQLLCKDIISVEYVLKIEKKSLW